MANRSSRNPGQVAQFDAYGRISGDVPSYAVDTGDAARALAAVAGGLSRQLGQMADKAAQREGQIEGLSHGQRQGATYLEHQATAASAAGVARTGPWMEQAKALLRDEEGFRDTPYWDVTAHRVGYGSDTTIGADGKPVRVAPGMKISREQAERDLEYRLTQREGARVQKQLGERWAGLPESAKAALVSVGYNYGSLPKSVVAAAQTGDIGAIADAVGALPANKKRRQREAAMIRGAGAPAVDPIVTAGTSAGTSTGTAKAPEPASPPLSAEPLALRRDGTIRGEAFDDAALSAWGWRMQQGLATDLFAAQQQFEDDPGGFAAAAKDIRDRYAAELPNDPVAREMFDRSFAQNSEAYTRSIATRYEAKLKAEQLAAYAGGLSARQIDLERQAQVLGANPDGDRIIGEQVAAAQRSIDGAYQQGIITAAQAEKQKLDIAETAARGRIQGVYDALPTPEGKEQFALSLLTDWKEQTGPLASLPFSTVKGISDTLFNDAREQINRRTAANKGEKARVEALIQDDVASIAATGKGLDPATSGLTPDAVRALAGDQAVAQWQLGQDKARKLYGATGGMEIESTADIMQRLAVMKPQAGKPGFADDMEIWEAANKRAREVLKERETDPLGQAARGGAIEITAIDPSSPERLNETLAERRQQRDKVAGLYEQQVPLFRSGEKELLASAMTRQPDMLPAFAQSVRTVFGNDAPKVLAEISEDAPVIAHAAGLAIATGDNSVAADVATTLALKREKVFAAKMPSQAEMSTFAATEIGGALSADPKTQGAMVQTAAILFEQMANAQGFDASELKTEGSTAQAAFARALDRAAGGRIIGGKPYGGFAEVNGARVLVPSDMPKERPQQLMQRLSAEQLAKLPPIETGNGFDIPISDIRGANLRSIGDGLYLVALGDPMGDDPRYLITPDGRPWQLDIRELERVAQETPGAGVGGFNYFGWQPGQQP